MSSLNKLVRQSLQLSKELESKKTDYTQKIETLEEEKKLLQNEKKSIKIKK